MKDLIVSVPKREVYNEVSQESAYVGAKSEKEDDYDRVSATQEDNALFEGYWAEASSAVTDLLKRFVVSVSGTNSGVNLDDDYTATLSMPENFNDALKDSIETSLYKFFSNFIKSKWFALTKKDDAERYAQMADAMLTDVKSKIYFRNRPVKRTK